MSSAEDVISLQFHSDGNRFALEAELWVRHLRETIFSFFADALNLEVLTVPLLHFHIITPGPTIMETGTLIDYSMRLRGVPIRWQSEITAWDPPHRFIDKQRRGPYRPWVHEHNFIEQEGGTLVRDRVSYSVCGSWVADKVLVQPDLRRIFAYRYQQIQSIFADQLLKESAPPKEQG